MAGVSPDPAERRGLFGVARSHSCARRAAAGSTGPPRCPRRGPPPVPARATRSSDSFPAMVSQRAVSAFVSACSIAAIACTVDSGTAFSADRALSVKRAKNAATKHARAKGRARYPYDTFKVKVRACKREARFKVACKATIRGVKTCLRTKCAPRSPGFYREECTWRSVVSAYGRGHRRTRVNAYRFHCKLGDEIPSPA